jgi:hypothetical protein
MSGGERSTGRARPAGRRRARGAPAPGRALAAALVLASAATARAADVPRRDLHRFGFDGTSRDTLAVRTGEIEPDGQFRLYFASEWEDAPFVLDGSGNVAGGGLGAPSGTRSTTRSSASLGMSAVFWRRLELTLRVPVVLSQGGGDPNRWGTVPSDLTGTNFPISLRGRLGVATQTKDNPVSVALSVQVMPLAVSVVPPPHGDDAMQASDEMGVSGRLELGHRFDRWLLGANLGAIFRSPIPYGSQRLGSELTTAIVAATTTGRLRGEVSAQAAFNFDGLPAAAELLFGGRWAWGASEVFALAGPGLGAAPGVPLFRFLVGVSWQTDRIVEAEEDEYAKRRRLEQLLVQPELPADGAGEIAPTSSAPGAKPGAPSATKPADAPPSATQPVPTAPSAATPAETPPSAGGPGLPPAAIVPASGTPVGAVPAPAPSEETDPAWWKVTTSDKKPTASLRGPIPSATDRRSDEPRPSWPVRRGTGSAAPAPDAAGGQEKPGKAPPSAVKPGVTPPSAEKPGQSPPSAEQPSRTAPSARKPTALPPVAVQVELPPAAGDEVLPR